MGEDQVMRRDQTLGLQNKELAQHMRLARKRKRNSMRLEETNLHLTQAKMIKNLKTMGLSIIEFNNI